MNKINILIIKINLESLHDITEINKIFTKIFEKKKKDL